MAERRPKTPQAIIKKYQPLVEQRAVDKAVLHSLARDILDAKGEKRVELPGEIQVIVIRGSRPEVVGYRFTQQPYSEYWDIFRSEQPRGSERYISMTFYQGVERSVIVTCGASPVV